MSAWLAGIAVVLGAAVLAAGQTTGPGDVPTACLDRSTVRAMEPVCLAVVAHSLPDNPVRSVQVLGPGDAPEELGNLQGHWGKSQLEVLGRVVEQRVSVALAADPRQAKGPGTVDYLFAKPGDYTIRVVIGSQTNDLPLKVEAGNPDDGRAFASLGADSMEGMLNEAQKDDASPRLVAACADVVSHFPHTTCADYARAYLAVANFKDVFKVHNKAGGRAIYGDPAARLAEVLTGVRDSFYGEQVGFYSAYAFGLEREFPDLLRTVDSVPSRLTPWGDKMEQMKQEVLAHTLGQAGH